jgi:hypothetical protein
MKQKDIHQAIQDGKVVVLKGDPKCRLCSDLFGNLIVVSLRPDEPTRLATLKDKRNAVIR